MEAENKSKSEQNPNPINVQVVEEKEGQLIDYTSLFGTVVPTGIYFDDWEKIEKDYLKYRVSSVKIFLEEVDGKQIVGGIQFFYKNLVDNTIFTPGEHHGKNYSGFQEITLERNEYLTDVHLKWDNKNLTQLGFSTNKRKEIKYGDDSGINMKMDLANRKVMIFAPFGNIGDRMGAIAFNFMILKEYNRRITMGYFELKKLVRKKEKWEERVKTLQLDESNEILVRVCNLPDGPFYSIVKFCL